MLEKIKEFLASRPGIKPYEIERIAEIPRSSLSHFLSGRRPLPKSHIEPLARTLIDYGFRPEKAYYLSINQVAPKEANLFGSFSGTAEEVTYTFFTEEGREMAREQIKNFDGYMVTGEFELKFEWPF